MEKWIRARYQPNLPLEGDRRVTASPEHIALSRRAAQEGAVLLKNNGNLLPLAPDARVALFGKGSFDYVKGGGGSGDVTVAYVKNLYDGLKEEGVPLYEPLSDFYRDYVAGRYQAGDIPGLMPEVREHEPLQALDGGGDGLVFYRRILEEGRKHLFGGGMLFFEIGHDQSHEVSCLMEEAGFLEVDIVKDYAGLDRVVYGTFSHGPH